MAIIEGSKCTILCLQMSSLQFRSQSTLMGVSQSVVHKCDQMHHDAFIRQMRENQFSSIKTREDIILLVRNFNFPMPNAIHKNQQQVGVDVSHFVDCLLVFVN